MPAAIGKSYGAVMLIILAVTILQLVIRFMRVATSEILGDISPIFKNAHIGTIIASLLTLILVLTGWWQYLWILFGGANQLMASLALMLMTLWLMSQGKPYKWTFYPMIFMFVTTIAALVVTSFRLFRAVFTGAVKGEAYIGNILMGLVAVFLIIAALILAVEGLKAFGRYKTVKAEAAPARA
jgi:carbon starvation protein